MAPTRGCCSSISAGKRLYWWGTWGMQPGQFWEPHQISTDAEGNLYIADSFGGRTQKYVPSKTGDPARLLKPDTRAPATSPPGAR